MICLTVHSYISDIFAYVSNFRTCGCSFHNKSSDFCQSQLVSYGNSEKQKKANWHGALNMKLTFSRYYNQSTEVLTAWWLQEGWRSRENVKGNNKWQDHIKSSKYYETTTLKTGGPFRHYIAHLSPRTQKYTHLRHENQSENSIAGVGRIFWSFCPIIWRDMSMLNHIPSSRNNFHVLEESVWKMQNS